MADAFGLSDVSTPDTGKGSELKTGGRRKHNMPGEKACDKYTGKEKQDCLNYRGRFAKMAKVMRGSKGAGSRPQGPSSTVEEEMIMTVKPRLKGMKAKLKKKQPKYVPY